MMVSFKKTVTAALGLVIVTLSFVAACHVVNPGDVGAPHDVVSAGPASAAVFVASAHCCIITRQNAPWTFLANIPSPMNAMAYLLTVAVALFACGRLNHNKQSRTGKIFLAHMSASRLWHYLQEAFAQGILHPKIDDPAIV